MADETEFTRQRVHDDFNASNEAARAAAQAAILINGGAATALLAFLSKATPPPPFLVRAARVSLGLYALGMRYVVHVVLSTGCGPVWQCRAWGPNWR
jgi:hypothetical protein